MMAEPHGSPSPPACPRIPPSNTVREDPLRKGLLFAGTETAVWVSLDDGDHWLPLQYNLPHSSMRDLMIQGNDLIVATHGRSFWILDDITPLRQLSSMDAQTAPILFKPGEAYRVRRSTYTDTPMPPDEAAGENPPDGAIIDYSLPASVQGPVTLEILDSANKVVRRYASNDAPQSTLEQLSKQLIPLYWLRMPKTLPASAGMHRWVWDLRYAPPTATNYEYPISAVPHDTPRTPQGALVLPGIYQARLTVDGKVQTAPLTIKMDPRVDASRADLETLFKLEYHLYDLLSSTSEADLQAHSTHEQIEKLSASVSAEIREQLETRDKELSALLSGKEKSEGGEEEPGIDAVAGEASALYAQVGMADAAPTAAQQKATQHLSDESVDVLQKWETLKKSVLPELNRQLTRAHLPIIHPEERPESMPESGDED